MKLSLRAKLALSLSSIAAVLLISATISVMEYRAMRTYVSDLIADDIRSINAAQKLSDISNKYNLEILALIGDDFYAKRPEFDDRYFMSYCDSLRSTLKVNAIMPLTDSIAYSYSAYMLTSLELDNVLDSYYLDSRTWYFDRLQPGFERLSADIYKLESAIYQDLERNSKTFERGFYRSVIPGIVAICIGLLLLVALLFYLMAYYVSPIYRMNNSLDGYLRFRKNYNCEFDGDDQLAAINEGIGQVISENVRQRERIKELKSRKEENVPELKSPRG